MIAVTAISEPALRRELFDVLSTAGWAVHHARDGTEALAHCRALEADVLMIDEGIDGGAVAFLDRVNRSPELLETGVVVVGERLDVDEVVSALRRGAADVLRTPVDPADAIARATSAARTKALVKQLTSENQRMEGLVMFDELTSMRNRRAILLELDTLIATARRHERPLAVLMIDVDRFKAINDTRGHRAGDEVLREVTRRITGRLRDADVGGRLGGDELLILLPETEAVGAAVLADSIRGAISERPIRTPDGPIDVTVSIGAAAWEGEPSELLLERADQALYAAKAAGRDRSVAL
ncbi:MAG: two-component system, cell cycle response regulator [Solirubrobacteraceae bacterium]|nr:two-component system, cell cycle response regulator [Solirubrobacteraceae bacterium]